MATFKTEFVIGLQHENCYSVEGDYSLVGGRGLVGKKVDGKVYWRTFPDGWEEWENFWLVGREFPYPLIRKTLNCVWKLTVTGTILGHHLVY